jgi:hypothetical protein
MSLHFTHALVRIMSYVCFSLKVDKFIVFNLFSNRNSFQHRSGLVKDEIILVHSVKTLPEVEE